ncbi:MAG: sigma-54 dependent transcriptional regulator [Sulfuritalea sp.]|jgi:two-component system response regulator FlrC|nr:sigma-54 dependent transcriptional regulator [Sulfuritalea sp.]
MSDSLKILVVEDDDALRDALLITLEAAGHRATGADGGAAALSALATAAREPFSMVVSDLRMDPMDGLTLLGEIRSRHPGLPVLLMTAFGDVDKAVAAMRGGACDFMLKPFEPKTLIEQIARYAVPPPPADGVIAADPKTRETLLLAARVAKTDATVLLTGESGVGKEVFARYIHDQSTRAGGPFVAINCAAIPDSLLEATLFGYEKGAFTGAQTAQAGKFEQANGGTLLLDEISEMPLGLQAKLLRVLQEREVERVGGKKPVALDIRILATSNRDMSGEVRVGRFREDLYYRLNVFPLEIPALRQRPGDILPLARHCLARQAVASHRAARFAAAAEARLVAYAWPGNVRELENVVQRALIMTAGEVIEADSLPLNGAMAPVGADSPAALASAQVAVPSAPTFAGTTANAGSPANMKDLERQHILDTLAKFGGSRKKAVAILGISERTLRYKLSQYRAEGFFNDDEEP